MQGRRSCPPEAGLGSNGTAGGMLVTRILQRARPKVAVYAAQPDPPSLPMRGATAGPTCSQGDGTEPLKGKGTVLPEFDMPSGQALCVAIISALVAGRQEVIKLLLGFILVLRARREDLPALARALFPSTPRWQQTQLARTVAHNK